MALKYRQAFTVEGSGQFPHDMLRYDQCFPVLEQESGKLARGFDGEQRTVQMQRYVETRTDMPTEGRWRSFDWHVVVGTVITVKLS